MNPRTWEQLLQDAFDGDLSEADAAVLATRLRESPEALDDYCHQALLETEGVTINFADEAIERLAEIAWSVNERTENIGARRLHTVMERLLDEISFDANKRSGETLLIDAAYVDARLKELAASEDLARYVL
jgi:ATP-dependent protease HslVU (ClpYQ) ATPase subunit